MLKHLKAILLVLLAAIPPVHAGAYVYDWSYSSPLYTGSGTLSVDPAAPQNGGAGIFAYVPVISGTFNGETITGLDGSGDYNNFLYFQNPTNASYTLTYPQQPLWQVYELGFLTTADEYVMNGTPFDGYETFDNNNGGSGGLGDDGYNSSGASIGSPGSFSITVVPEPSVNMMFIGVAGLFFGWRSWRGVGA